MKMKTKSQKGFTLIELIIAAAAGAILVLAAGTVLFIGHTSWDKAWKKVNLQREASYAMLRISGPIKAGSSAELENDGKAIKIYREAGWIRFFLAESGNELLCEIEGQDPEIIINSNVEDLQFNVADKRVGIDLRLREDNIQTHLVSTVMIRNYGG